MCDSSYKRYMDPLYQLRQQMLATNDQVIYQLEDVDNTLMFFTAIFFFMISTVIEHPSSHNFCW